MPVSAQEERQTRNRILIHKQLRPYLAENFTLHLHQSMHFFMSKLTRSVNTQLNVYVQFHYLIRPELNYTGMLSRFEWNLKFSLTLADTQTPKCSTHSLAEVNTRCQKPNSDRRTQTHVSKEELDFSRLCSQSVQSYNFTKEIWPPGFCF